MKRLIIYDLDGTLVDTGQDIANAANHMLQQLRGAPLPAEEIRQFVGRGLHDLVKRCLQTDDAQLIETGARMFFDYYGQHLADHSRLYPHAKEVLEHFQPRTQAVVTNKPQPFGPELLTRLGVAHYFTQIIGVGSSYPKKPDPASIFALMQQQDLEADDVLLVGDSPVDIETGRNAGVFTVIVAQGFAEYDAVRAAAPDLLVPDLRELLVVARQRRW